MKAIIEEKLNMRGLLQHAKAGSDREKAREDILDKLPKNVGGSYSLLKFGMDNVIRILSTRTAIKDLDEMLTQSINSREVAIDELQRSLTGKEINELNELLKWVLFSGTALTLDQLESVMYLSSGIESPLASLEYIITNKYSALLKIEGDYVYGQDNVKAYVKRKTHNSGSSMRPTISMSIKINDVDQEMCGHFFWDLAQQTIRHNFKFDFDTDSKNPNSRRNSIAVDEFEAHHTIVTWAFDYLQRKHADQTKVIGLFLVFWLPYHLDRLRQLEDDDKGTLMPGQRVEVGRNLYYLFKDEQVFERHRESFQTCYWTEEKMGQVKMWLMDSTTVRNVRKLDPKWLKEVQGAVNPVRGFLKELVKAVVKGLLRDRSWNAQNAYTWIKEFMKADSKGFSDTHDINDGDASSSSSSTGSSVEVDWEEVSKWCQDYLALPNSALDSLWYERLAEVASSQGSKAGTVLSLYGRAIGQGNPSWLCYRGMGETYFHLGNDSEAIAEVEVALGKAQQDGTTPKPEVQDLANLHLMLGEYAYRAQDAPKAAHHYQEARMSDDKDQVRRGQLGHLKAVMDLPNPGVKVESMQSLLTEEDGKGNMVHVLKMIARDGDHDNIMSKIFAASIGHRDLFRAIIRALETATANAELGEYRASQPLSDARFAEEESCGVLLYYRGIAAYKYKVSPEGTEPVGTAVKLWLECRDQLSGVGGSNASVVRQDATREMAKHYFHNMMDGEHRDDIGVLSELAGAGSKIIITDPSSYLAALYALRRDYVQSKLILGPGIRYALEILSDGVLENDRFGLYLIFRTLPQYGDLKNAAVAMSLWGQPDLVTEALHFEAHDIAEVSDPEEDRALDILTKLSRETVKAAGDQVPDASQQLRRLEVARLHIESRLSDTQTKIIARDVRALESDDKILEILYAEEGEGQEITVEQWKAALAEEWDIRD
ncbi:hypothetical protein SLS63_010586 [Diaporthe eres]|uniref:Uncharacterized protein n=1 Tax=Diaporthe eres TaxID=83184 RepID=A0ABR1NWK2_DIAER